VSQVILFEKLNPSALAKFYAILSPIVYAAESQVCLLDRNVDMIFIVVHGELELRKEDKLLGNSRRETGYIGRTALLPQEPKALLKLNRTDLNLLTQTVQFKVVGTVPVNGVVGALETLGLKPLNSYPLRVFTRHHAECLATTKAEMYTAFVEMPEVIFQMQKRLLDAEIRAAMKANAPLEEIKHWEMQLRWVVTVETKNRGRPLLFGHAMERDLSTAKLAALKRTDASNLKLLKPEHVQLSALSQVSASLQKNAIGLARLSALMRSDGSEVDHDVGASSAVRGERGGQKHEQAGADGLEFGRQATQAVSRMHEQVRAVSVCACLLACLHVVRCRAVPCPRVWPTQRSTAGLARLSTSVPSRVAAGCAGHTARLGHVAAGGVPQRHCGGSASLGS
jgi:hypothetical protein